MTNPIVYWQDWWSGLSTVERAVVGALFVAAIIIILVTPAGAQGVPDVSNNAVWIALIAAIPVALTGPLIAYMNERSRRKDREEDRLERMEVAARAHEGANLLAINTAKAATTAQEANSKLVEVAKVANVIHTLVNSQLTGSKQAEFNAITRELALLHELGGEHPSPRITEAIKTAEINLAELKAVLADRQITASDVERQQRDQS
jgi:hypothetical protein